MVVSKQELSGVDMKMRKVRRAPSKIRIAFSLAVWFFLMPPLVSMPQNVVTQWNYIAIAQARASAAPGAASSGATSLYVAYVEPPSITRWSASRPV